MNETIHPSLRDGLRSIRLAIEENRADEAFRLAEQCAEAFTNYVRRLKEANLWQYTADECGHRGYVINYIQCTVLVAFKRIPEFKDICAALRIEHTLASEFQFYHEQGRFANHWDNASKDGCRNISVRKLLDRRKEISI